MRVDYPHLFFRSILVVALMLLVVVTVMFGIDLINGRWDQPPIEFQPQL